jgi:hypothetical protein
MRTAKSMSISSHRPLAQRSQSVDLAIGVPPRRHCFFADAICNLITFRHQAEDLGPNCFEPVVFWRWTDWRIKVPVGVEITLYNKRSLGTLIVVDGQRS